ncbi:MAG: family 16 glycosylhydrolase [Actinobacteria bacterium]|nr:family 16 glycosylhydrolase [Actinomycetota bacterium]
MKSLKGSLAFLISISLLSIVVPFSAQADVTNQPQINYSDNTGLNFAVAPASISGFKSPKIQWFVGGKAVAGGTKTAFKATAKQKNQSIQLKVTSAGTTAASVVGTIGQVIVNVKPTVTLADSAGTKVLATPGVFSPKTAKVTYQWFKGPIEIGGAKSSTYIPAATDQGFKFFVSANYSAKGFTDNKADSGDISIPVTKRTYLQVWQDEFNGTAGSAPDSAIWAPENGDGSKAVAGGGWGNKERQYYIPSLAKITSTGALQIDATTTGANEYNCYYKTPCEWISSKYITKDKVGFKYGRLEARIKGPVGSGTWGAFWMLGADIDARIWPWCGEIDVTELVGKAPNTAYGYLHGLLSGGFGGRGTTVDMPNGFANEYHTYAVDWLPESVDWYVDGVLFGSQQKKDKDWVFDHEFYLVVNLAMGGNLGGTIEPGLKQANISFDWIRFSTINGVGEVIKH